MIEILINQRKGAKTRRGQDPTKDSMLSIPKTTTKTKEGGSEHLARQKEDFNSVGMVSLPVTDLVGEVIEKVFRSRAQTIGGHTAGRVEALFSRPPQIMRPSCLPGRKNRNYYHGRDSRLGP